MSTNTDNTASIEEMINANLGIDPSEATEPLSSESPLEENDVEALTEANTPVTDTTTEDVLTSINIDTLLNDASDDDTTDPVAEEISEVEAIKSIAEESENTTKPEIIVEADTKVSIKEGHEAPPAESSQDTALDDLLSNAMEDEPEPTSTEADHEETIEPVTNIDEPAIDDQPKADAEEDIQEIPVEEPTKISTEESKNSPPELASERVANADIDTVEEPKEINVETEASEPIENNLPGAEAIQSLETEVAELDSEIQTQIDQFAIQADHLKANIQGELQRVCSDNELLHEQIKDLEQQLLSAEDKIQGFTEIQDKQQVTIHKLILIVKGIRSKISHLYDE